MSLAGLVASRTRLPQKLKCRIFLFISNSTSHGIAGRAVYPFLMCFYGLTRPLWVCRRVRRVGQIFLQLGRVLLGVMGLHVLHLHVPKQGPGPARGCAAAGVNSVVFSHVSGAF